MATTELHKGIPTAVLSIRRKYVAAFIVAELERTSPSSATTRYRSLQQLFDRLGNEGEIKGSPMAKIRPPKIPEKPVSVLSDDHVRLLPAIFDHVGGKLPDWHCYAPGINGHIFARQRGSSPLVILRGKGPGRPAQ